MCKRSAPIAFFAISLFLAGCVNQSVQPEHGEATVAVPVSLPKRPVAVVPEVMRGAEDDERAAAEFAAHATYTLPNLADSLLEKGRSLIGTRYRFGGSSVRSGFDCSGFIGYLFREELGMSLPRSTREMINIDAPLIARQELEPGDVLFFSTAGRGRVSHAGIYIGDDQFIHSSSRRSGGVRIDSLDDSYWRRTFIEAKRVLALAPLNVSESQQ
jgi:lipoprotein Spr